MKAKSKSRCHSAVSDNVLSNDEQRAVFLYIEGVSGSVATGNWGVDLLPGFDVGHWRIREGVYGELPVRGEFLLKLL